MFTSLIKIVINIKMDKIVLTRELRQLLNRPEVETYRHRSYRFQKSIILYTNLSF